MFVGDDPTNSSNHTYLDLIISHLLAITTINMTIFDKIYKLIEEIKNLCMKDLCRRN